MLKYLRSATSTPFFVSYYLMNVVILRDFY